MVAETSDAPRAASVTRTDAATPPIRLLLVDHHALLTDALGRLLADEPDLEVRMAASGEEALTIAAVDRPAVAVVALSLPGIGGLATIRGLRALSDRTAIVALSTDDDRDTAFEIVDAGASGLVSKLSPASELLRSIRYAASGRITMPDRRRARAPRRPRAPADDRRAPDRRLTDREVEVLRLAATGMSNRRIANALYLSEHTVLGYLKSLSVKLGVHSKLQAVVLGISEGLIPLPGRETEGERVTPERSGRDPSSGGER
jgi:DNA-binding NarL/FixJ family response regulator